MRMLDVDYHGFDWRVLNPKVGGRDHTLHFRILGVGFDLRHLPSVRSHSFSCGVSWLLNLAVGFKRNTSDLSPSEPNAWTTHENLWVQIDVLGWSFGANDSPEETTFKVFWRGKRKFFKKVTR